MKKRFEVVYLDPKTPGAKFVVVLLAMDALQARTSLIKYGLNPIQIKPIGINKWEI